MQPNTELAVQTNHTTAKTFLAEKRSPTNQTDLTDFMSPSSEDKAKMSTTDESPHQFFAHLETSSVSSSHTLYHNYSYEHTFKEDDVLEMPVTQFGKEIKLKAYRYPPKNYRKAVVFYMHGYGSYANQNACFAKYLADFDFEVFALDQRGFGESEGERAVIEKAEDIYNDQWLLILEAIKHYKIN